MDDQQHALAGLLRTIPIAEATAAAGPGRLGPRRRLAVRLAVGRRADPRAQSRAGRLRDPARRALPAGHGPPGGRGRARSAALAVCVVAALADPLLDALDVSDPSFRVAAGIVAVIAGAADLFRRPPPPEPSLPGWRAALVPVAVPVVTRPALVVLALGAGADQDLLVVAAADGARASRSLPRWSRGRPTEGPGRPGPPVGRPPAGGRPGRLRSRPRDRRRAGRLSEPRTAALGTPAAVPGLPMWPGGMPPPA